MAIAAFKVLLILRNRNLGRETISLKICILTAVPAGHFSLTIEYYSNRSFIYNGAFVDFGVRTNLKLLKDHRDRI